MTATTEHRIKKLLFISSEDLKPPQKAHMIIKAAALFIALSIPVVGIP